MDTPSSTAYLNNNPHLARDMAETLLNQSLDNPARKSFSVTYALTNLGITFGVPALVGALTGSHELAVFVGGLSVAIDGVACYLRNNQDMQGALDRDRHRAIAIEFAQFAASNLAHTDAPVTQAAWGGFANGLKKNPVSYALVGLTCGVGVGLGLVGLATVLAYKGLEAAYDTDKAIIVERRMRPGTSQKGPTDSKETRLSKTLSSIFGDSFEFPFYTPRKPFSAPESVVRRLIKHQKAAP